MLFRKVLMITLCALCLLSMLGNSQAQGSDHGMIRGMLLERGTAEPVSDVSIYIFLGESEKPVKTITTKDGKFELDTSTCTETLVTFKVNVPDYEPFSKQELINPCPDRSVRQDLRLFIERNKYGAYETVVSSNTLREDASKKGLKRSQFLTLPGSGGDPIRAVQDLPGVNRAQSFDARVIIQGASPQDTVYMINGHTVPNIFHFGGLTSVVYPEAISKVDYWSAGFGSEYGRTNAGLVGVVTVDQANAESKKTLEGNIFLDTFSSGMMLKGKPSDKTGWMISGRQSYVGQVLRKVLKNSDEFNLTVAPTYRDLSAQVDTQFDDRNQFKFYSILSDDRLAFLFPQPLDSDPSLRGTFSDQSSFYRLIPEWAHQMNSDLRFTTSMGFGKDWIRFESSENYFRLSSTQWTPKFDLEKNWNLNPEKSGRLVSVLGADVIYTQANVDIQFRNFYTNGGVPNPFSTGEVRRTTIHPTFWQIGTYQNSTWSLVPQGETQWTLIPGLREDYYNETGEYLVFPRFTAKFKRTSTLTYRFQTGLYGQPPLPQETDLVFGNPKIRSSRSAHFVLGMDKDFRAGQVSGFVLKSSGFYKQLSNLVTPSTKPGENYNNSGSGRVYGLENRLSLESDSKDPYAWGGWTSYTLSRSTRWTLLDSKERPSAYDQTHILTVLGSKGLGHHWTVSSRGRYVTGAPSTDVIGSVYDSDHDVYIPIRGSIFAERLDHFFQLDIRFDKKWIYDTWILSLYLDVQNVTNRKNVEQVQYSYNFRQKDAVSGLPIFPTFGLRAEF